VPQLPSFLVDGEWISISPPDGERLIDALQARMQREPRGYPDYEALRAAAKLTRAMALGHSTTVELAIGEDEAVLAALSDLRAEDQGFLRALVRLERALDRKIAARAASD
jgi:hypothetical protein